MLEVQVNIVSRFMHCFMDNQWRR